MFQLIIILADEKMTFYRFNFLDKGNAFDRGKSFVKKNYSLESTRVPLSLFLLFRGNRSGSSTIGGATDGIAILFIRNNETFWLGRTWINPFLVFHFCFLIKFL